MKEIINMVWKMVQEHIHGQMEKSIKDNGNKIKWMVMVYVHGQMVDNILENG